MGSIADESSRTTAVILLHGMTSSPTEMLNLTEAITAAGFTAISPLLPGHDTSISEMKKVRLTQWKQCAEEAYLATERLNTEKIFVVGLSFGALLALFLAENHNNKINGIVLLSPPYRLRSTPDDLALSALSYLPEVALDILPISEKRHRPEARFSQPRQAYDQHSIGASARMMTLRREVLKSTANICCRTLILSDPDDHLVSSNSPKLLAEKLHSAKVEVKYFLGGLHELNIGPFAADITKEVLSFISGSGSKPSA